MNVILVNSLYHMDKTRFCVIGDMAKGLNATCNGNNIVQDDIFNVIRNYGRRHGQQIELIRLPVNDEEFCACTFVRKGRIFIVSNSHLVLSKQIFAAAHELYHIIKYVKGEDEDFPLHGSILKSDVLEAMDAEAEDRDANAFAGLFLAPSNALKEQIDIYSITLNSPGIKDILRLMDIFAIPYKAVIIRLYEENLISEKKADELLRTNGQIIEKEMNLTGIAERWQKKDNSIEWGSLKEDMAFNEKSGMITDTRVDADKERIKKLIDAVRI